MKKEIKLKCVKCENEYKLEEHTFYIKCPKCGENVFINSDFFHKEKGGRNEKRN